MPTGFWNNSSLKKDWRRAAGKEAIFSVACKNDKNLRATEMHICPISGIWPACISPLQLLRRERLVRSRSLSRLWDLSTKGRHKTRATTASSQGQALSGCEVNHSLSPGTGKRCCSMPLISPLLLWLTYLGWNTDWRAAGAGPSPVLTFPAGLLIS